MHYLQNGEKPVHGILFYSEGVGIFVLFFFFFFVSADSANVVGAKGDTSEKRSPFVPSVSIHILPTVLNKQMMTIKRVF